MKKFMTIVLAAGLVFAVAGQASATALETSGEYRGRYWYFSNLNQAGEAAGTADETFDIWDQRLRLGMTWKVSDSVTVGARADILENVWQTGNASYSAGDASTEMDFDWAYAAFKIAPETMVTVGKQDVTWGPGVYAKSDNRYRAKIGTKFDKVGVGFAYDMLLENKDAQDLGDQHGFSLSAVFPVSDWNIGVLGLARIGDVNAETDNTLVGADVYAMGALGPVKLTAEAIYAAGEIDPDNAESVDQSGFLGYLGATMPVGPVMVGAEFAYATGDDPDTTDENEGAIKFDYQSPFWSVLLYNNFDLNGLESTGGLTDSSVSNAMALKISGTMQLTKQLSLYGAWIYADRIEDVKTATGVVEADALGNEFDALLFYDVNENVRLQCGFGYLVAGDYYENQFGEVDDPWGATAHAIVKF